MVKSFYAVGRVLKSIFVKDNSYTFALIPDNGEEIKKTVFSNSQFRAVLCVAAFSFTALLGTACYYSYMLNASAAERQELAEFRRVKQAQEQRLQELSIVSDKLQGEMAKLNELELEVKHQMEQAGMQVEK